MQTVAHFILGIVLIFTPTGVWTQCPKLNSALRQFMINPTPVEYDSGRIRATGAGSVGLTQCVGTTSATCVGSTPIDDGEREPVSLTDLRSTFAWNQDVNMLLTLNTPTRVRGVNLFFYNIPSMGIGLPHEIELKWGTAELNTPNRLGHAILGNSDLSQDDNTTRNVTIAAIAGSSNDETNYRSLSITFRFSDTSRIRWMILSEIEICSDQVNFTPRNSIPVTINDSSIRLGPNDVLSQINLTCTVEIEGSFQWVWSVPRIVNPQQFLADTNRTSSITLTELSTDSTGTYSCRAMYDPQSLGIGVTSNVTGSRSFVLQVDNEITEALNDTVVATLNSSVTLACEVYGYLPRGSSPQISWMKGSETIAQSNQFMISTSDGSRQIQNGGSTPTPSLVSSLTINVKDDSVAGTYGCIGRSFLKPIELKIEGGSSSSTEATTSVSAGPTQSTQSVENTMFVIIGAAAVGAVVVIILVIVIIVVVIFFVMRAKHRLNHYHLGSNGESKDFEMYDGEEPFYQELSKPAPPPIPAHFPSPMGSQIDPYAMVNNATGNGHFELMERSFDNRVSVCSEPESNTMPMRLNKQPNFLQNNPLYASADALDRDNPPNLPFRREVGSVPPLDYSDSPRGSAFNIYAQPSRVAPPIPDRPSTPTLLGGPIYSEANISPAVFKHHRRSTASPPEVEQMCPYASIYNDPKPLQISEGPLEVSAHNVREKRSLGVGQFGQVILAETVGVSLKDLNLSDENDDKSVSVLVAVKKLKPDADHFIKEAFEKEIKFMTRLKHENVVQLLGICLHGDAFIIMEYMESGDLNQYLHKNEIALPGSVAGKNQLHPSTLLYMSMQIANGMKYLASFHFIHRDLATRNCLVSKNNEVKIADFGMSRSLYSSYYYRIRGRAMLPIRWMANECFYGKFSEKTDVWAFGVTMWEIFTFAKKQPYENMTDQEVIDDAIKGPDRQLLSRPEHCPPEVFDVMVGCWVDDPDKRVNFNHLHSSLAAIYDSSSAP